MNKIPYDITFHPVWWHKFADVSFQERFFTDYTYRIEQDIKMRKTLYDYFGHLGLGEKNPHPRPIIDTDLVAGEYLQALLLGCKIMYFTDSYPETICKNMTDEEIEELVVPILSLNEDWMNIEEQMEKLQKDFGYVESHLDLHGVQNLALSLRGQQLFIDYYQNKKIAKKLLSICTEILIAVGQRIKKMSRFLSCGVTSIMHKINPEVYVTSNCTVEMVSDKIYEEFLLEWDIKLSQNFPIFGIHHCGQSTEHVAHVYKKVPNLSFLEVGAFSDIQKVRNVFPNIHLNLRYSPVKLKEITRKRLKEDLIKMIKEGSPTDKISFSCVGIDQNTPPEKIENFLITMKEINKEID
jgi:uroporphyrinogen-III decarboxylase